MLALQKFAAKLAMPMGLLFITLLALTVFVWWRKERLGLRIALTSLLAAYAVLGNVWVGRGFIGTLESQVAPLQDPAMPFDALFVLGGGTANGPNGPYPGKHGDRVVCSAALYKRGLTRRLVASGRTISELYGHRDLARETATIWRRFGVPESAILQIPGPQNTKQEVAAYARMIAEHGFKRVGVVSSAFHLPRVLKHFERHKIEVIPVPCDYSQNQPRLALVWFVPQSSGFLLTEHAAWEYLGMAVGR